MIIWSLRKHCILPNFQVTYGLNCQVTKVGYSIAQIFKDGYGKDMDRIVRKGHGSNYDERRWMKLRILLGTKVLKNAKLIIYGIMPIKDPSVHLFI